MSLVTIQRSESPSDDTDSSLGLCDDAAETTIQSEDFFTSSATAVLQNQFGRRRSSIIKVEDTMQNGLKKAVSLLRKEDKIKLMVSIEKVNSKMQGNRYFCVLLTNGKQSEGEYLILGVDYSFNEATIGLVLPICQDMSVALDGDSGFKVKNKDGEKLFKPTSVHALWSTVQLLNKACAIAHQRNYYIGGLSHTWIGYYISKISSNRAQIAEWNRMIDANTITNSNMAPKSAIGEFVIGTQLDESIQTRDEIRMHLKEIMRDEDMDNITVTYLREKVQEKISFNIKDYRSFISEEILIIYGQMDSASEILPHLYLGSTYNASNLEELQKNKITHILNVTRESENFFREKFIYRNVEVFDVDETNLLNYFNDCYQYISEAKYQQSVCLVHCQRGISRSASVVIAYMMKEFNWSRDKAIEEVKKKRECILPNDSFMLQLKTYEGILKARRDFVVLISKTQRPSQQYSSKNRTKIMSFPNELLNINEKGDTVDSPTSPCPKPNQRHSASQVDRISSLSSINKAMVTLISLPSDSAFDPVRLEDVSLKEPYSENCLVDACNMTCSVLGANSPSESGVFDDTYQTDIINKNIPDKETSSNIGVLTSDQNANDISNKVEVTDLAKRSTLQRLRGDASWIKAHSDSFETNISRRDEVCRSHLIETLPSDNREELSQQSKRCHSAQMDPDSVLVVLDKDLDQLLTKCGIDPGSN